MPRCLRQGIASPGERRITAHSREVKRTKTKRNQRVSKVKKK
jgi:hypothetical protein